MIETPENKSDCLMKSNMVLGAFTRRLSKNHTVKQHFNSGKVILKPSKRKANKIDLFIGWGRKPQAIKASSFAKENNKPFVTLEDGFVHSMSQGRLGAESWSLVVDELGVFYDAKTASSLEQRINTAQLSTKQLDRACKNIETITQYNITKYNNAKLVIPKFILQLNKPVLVIDQVHGDMSIPYALASEKSFNNMLEAALRENPNSDLLIKIHPDVINGKRKGCITLPTSLPARVHIVSDNINPLCLLKYVEKVYVVSSQMGFEALMLKKTVVCFGAPFYAGWGLTEDRLPTTSDVFQRRQKSPSLATIFYAAYHDYSNYFHPDTQSPCELEDILDYVKLQYETWFKYKGKIFCIGFSPWKRKFIPTYLKTPDNEIFFVKNADEAVEKGFDRTSKACLWSSLYEEEANKLSAQFQTPIWRIEDGFIRSVSLGSNYAPPGSLVIDKQGLYFNPQKISDLESILLETDFTKEHIQSAEQLRTQLIMQAISKYNVGLRDLTNIFSEGGSKRKILIPGQVADDASIVKGCKNIASNIDLIKTVRRNHPEAYLIYKPHPDVLSGNRHGHVKIQELTEICDQIVTDISITDCLQQVDEVHTMTSLVGFEALMRGLKVYCYGIPFYSNWGLTVDYYHCERRTRQLSIDQLVAGTLLCYPLYINWDTRCLTTASYLADSIYEHLYRLKNTGKTQSVKPPTLRAKIGRGFNLLKIMFDPTLK